MRVLRIEDYICQAYNEPIGFDQMFDSNHDIIKYVDPNELKVHEGCLRDFFFDKEGEPCASLINMETGECNKSTEIKMSWIFLDRLNEFYYWYKIYNEVLRWFESAFKISRKESGEICNTCCLGANITWYHINNRIDKGTYGSYFVDTTNLEDSIFHVLKNSITHYKQDEDN